MDIFAKRAAKFVVSNGKLGLTACLVAVTSFAMPSISAAQNADIPQVAKQALATFSADPTWMGPTSSPPIAKGKFVISIPCAEAAIGCSRPGDAFLEAAKVMGWKTQLI